MKRKALKSLISMGLATAMLLTACGSSSSSVSNTASGETQESASQATEAEASSSEAASTQEAADTGSSDLVQLRFFNDETWWPYTVWEGRIPEKISEATGVTFEVTTAADSTALNLMIASGDLGDIILTSDNAKISRLQSSEMCYTLDELAQMAGEESFDVHPVLGWLILRMTATCILSWRAILRIITWNRRLLNRQTHRFYWVFLHLLYKFSLRRWYNSSYHTNYPLPTEEKIYAY